MSASKTSNATDSTVAAVKDASTLLTDYTEMDQDIQTSQHYMKNSHAALSQHRKSAQLQIIMHVFHRKPDVGTCDKHQKRAILYQTRYWHLRLLADTATSVLYPWFCKVCHSLKWFEASLKNQQKYMYIKNQHIDQDIPLICFYGVLLPKHIAVCTAIWMFLV